MRALMIVFWHYQLGDCRDMHIFLKLLEKGFKVSECAHHLQLSLSAIELLCQAKKECDNILSHYTQLGVGIMTYFDNDYPSQLKQMDLPPIILAYKGNRKVLKNKTITIVTEDMMSYYANQLLDSAIEPLKQATLVLSTLFNSSRMIYDYMQPLNISCILVLNSGFDRQYPVKHVFLESHISKYGIVVSEYPLGVSFCKDSVLRHRHLVVGLANIVFMLECMPNSPHLINVHIGIEQNKDLLVPPHKLFIPNGLASNLLIQQGARMYLSANDLQESMDEVFVY